MRVLEVKDISKSLINYYNNGGGKTYYLGFNALARHYSIKEGGCTDWTGYAGSGKTELLLECLKNCSEWYGHKHLIYMPDAGTSEEVIGKLIHKFSGKQFEKFYYNKEGQKIDIENRISEAEIYRWLPEVLEYFKVFVPETNNRSKAVTPKEFWDYAVLNKAKLGIFSAVIDSWNYLKHDTEGYSREDKWLEATLSYRNELAEKNNIHFHTIIHPTTAKKDNTGKIIMPDKNSLKGGSEWANNGKSIIIVHRDFDSNITDIKVDKAKPNVVGVQGLAALNYDIKIGKYFEFVNDGQGGRKKYAEKQEIKVSKMPTPELQNMPFNDNFANDISSIL